jgi:putative heme-binding domain-containing protein
LDNARLVTAIDSPNGWQRDTAHRLLVERKAKDTAPELRKLSANAESPKVRVQALATLATLQTIDPETIRTALGDSHPAVRVQALRGSETLAPDKRELVPDLIRCAEDSEFAVRRQLALTLGAFPGERSRLALEQMAEREGNNAEMRVAILSSVKPDDALFAALNRRTDSAPPVNFTPPKPSSPDRAKVIASYAPVASLKGAADRGREIFRQSCSVCHRLKGEGHELGPDLGMTADKPTDWLLTAILDPNAAIEDRYRAHTVKLTSGTELSGIVVTETTNNIVLRVPGGGELPVLRDQIANQSRAERSLMPEGLESVMKPQDVADLLAWIRKR